MKKRIVLALCSVLIATGGIGMVSIPHEEQPVSQELIEEALKEEEPEEEITEEEIAKEKVCLEGCTLEAGHEGDCVVKEEDVEVILKTTSMERDLKVKFVDKKTGKIISGADFKMKLTSPSKKTKEYSDKDKDGIIWVKDIDGGTYTVKMLDLEGYVTAKDLSAEVKKKIEYKVVEVAEEIKKESEINVSEEDAAYGGNAKDDSTTATVLQNTVESVPSTKKEVEVSPKVQKKDSFGNLVYEKQAVDSFKQPMYKELKKDEFGTPMYAKILSEPAKYHEDKDNNGQCDRCGATLKEQCNHVDENGDDKCDNCGEAVSGIHQHTEGDNGVCSKCHKVISPEAHKTCVDENSDHKCDNCGKDLPTPEPEPEPQDPVTDPNNAVVTDPLDPQSEPSEKTEAENHTLGVIFRPFSFLRTAQEKIVYDTTSAPIYDTTSAPIYDTKSAPVYESKGEVTYIYTGWQTIDGATYYFDKNGNKVTGHQVIDGVAYTFSSDGVRSGTIGIDVSKYQSGINWTKVKNAGINFAMIRCGYRGYGSGVLVEDPMFASHIKGAKAAGLRVGVYFFSQAVNEAEAVEEASMAVTLANKYGINMPIAIDSEYSNSSHSGRADGLSKSERTKVTKAFCNTVKSAGHTPMVYASKSWFSSHLDVSQLSSYRIWVAHYADKCGYQGTYHMWQNTSQGKVDGVPGRVDMNISSI